MPDASHSSIAKSHRASAAAARRIRASERRVRAQLRLQRRRVVVTAAVVLAVLVAGSGLLDWWADASGEQATRPTTPPVAPTPSPTADEPEPTPDPTTEPTQAPLVLSLPGGFPTAGSGQVSIAGGEGEVVGESGPVLRYRVAVETDAGEDVDEFAEFVDETLAHEQSWTAGGAYRFQRVGDGGDDFTVYLVTSQTAAQMCAEGGLVVIAPGLPEGGVSCRISGQVILNLTRWRLSVSHYVDAEVPLRVYRQMLLNHEVGHELGYGHYGCPGTGEPAPVMQQQSLRLDGCRPNPWPYLDGVHHTGPPTQ